MLYVSYFVNRSLKSRRVYFDEVQSRLGLHFRYHGNRKVLNKEVNKIHNNSETTELSLATMCYNLSYHMLPVKQRCLEFYSMFGYHSNGLSICLHILTKILILPQNDDCLQRNIKFKFLYEKNLKTIFSFKRLLNLLNQFKLVYRMVVRVLLCKYLVV